MKQSLLLGFALLIAMTSAWSADPVKAPKKIVLIAGALDKGHPSGTHEYEKAAALLKHCLEMSSNVSTVSAEVHLNGWPQDPRILETADTIALISSGADRNTQMHPFLVSDRLSVVEKQMQRGCGLVVIHWGVFVPKENAGDKFLDWIGGFFDYESGPPAGKWFSRIKTAKTTARPGSPEHPICRGISPFELQEEYYYNIRFRENDARLKPILITPIPGEPQEQTVAWAVERANGGRGFGFTGGHFYRNWPVENFRKMTLNALLWTAHVEVPEDGVQSSLPTEP